MKRRYLPDSRSERRSQLIAEYKRYHEKIWPEITRSIKDSGIEDMEIYLLGTRMFMIMEVERGFSVRGQGPGRPTQSKSAGVGDADGDVSAAVARGQARRKMAADGTGFQAGELALPHGCR